MVVDRFRLASVLIPSTCGPAHQLWRPVSWPAHYNTSSMTPGGQHGMTEPAGDADDWGT